MGKATCAMFNHQAFLLGLGLELVGPGVERAVQVTEDQLDIAVRQRRQLRPALCRQTSTARVRGCNVEVVVEHVRGGREAGCFIHCAILVCARAQSVDLNA